LKKRSSRRNNLWSLQTGALQRLTSQVGSFVNVHIFANTPCLGSKRQRKGKSKTTNKRKQRRDEKKGKQAAKGNLLDALKYVVHEEEDAPVKRCSTCINSAAEAMAQAEEILSNQPSSSGDIDDDIVHRRLLQTHDQYRAFREAADMYTQASFTHERKSNKLCPSYEKRQSLQTKERMAANMRHMTIKHGVENMITLPTDEKDALLTGFTKIVDFNRKLVQHATLFHIHLVTKLLNQGDDIPVGMFTQPFFYGLFQLLLGEKFTNKKYFDEDFRVMLAEEFEAFALEHPDIKLSKLPAVQVEGEARIPDCKYSPILSDTAIGMATAMKNHVVENLDAYVCHYLEIQLRHDFPVSQSLNWEIGTGSFFFRSGIDTPASQVLRQPCLSTRCARPNVPARRPATNYHQERGPSVQGCCAC
jgi:hypothetical protein